MPPFPPFSQTLVGVVIGGFLAAMAAWLLTQRLQSNRRHSRIAEVLLATFVAGALVQLFLARRPSTPTVSHSDQERTRTDRTGESGARRPEPSAAGPSQGTLGQFPLNDSQKSPKSTPAQPQTDAQPAHAERQTTTNQSLLVNRANFNPSVPAILFQDQDGVIEDLSQHVANALGGTDSLFLPEFVSSDRLARAQSGDASALAGLDLSNAASLIVFGKRMVVFSSEQVAGQDLVKADAVLSVRVYRPAAAFRSEHFTEHAIRAGFTKDDARRAVDDLLANQVIKRLQELR